MKRLHLKLKTKDLRAMQFTPIDAKDCKVTDLLSNSRIKDERYENPTDKDVKLYSWDVFDEIDSINIEKGIGSYHKCYLASADNEIHTTLTVTDENGNETKYEYLFENDDRCIDATFLKNYYYNYFAPTYFDGFCDWNPIDAEIYDFNEGLDVTKLFKRLRDKDYAFERSGFIRTHIETMLTDWSKWSLLYTYLLRTIRIGSAAVEFEVELEDNEEFDINKLFFVIEPNWWNSSGLTDTDGLSDMFYSHWILLDFVMYDGKVIGRNTENSVWRRFDTPGAVTAMTRDMSKTPLF